MFLASLLLGSALAGFQSDAYAQAQRGGSRSSSGASRSTSVQKPSSNPSTRKSPAVSAGTQTRPSGTASRPSGTTARPSGQQSRPSGSVSRPSGQTSKPSGSVSRPSGQQGRPSGSVSRPSGQQTRPSGGSVSKPADKPSSKPSSGPSGRPAQDYKPGNQNKPIGVTRPGSRPADRPQNGPSHRPAKPSGPVAGAPHRPSRPDGVKVPNRPPIYVYPRPVHRPNYAPRPPRPRPGVIIRPYYGTVIAHKIAANMAWTAVRLAYYSSVARTYSLINDNNAYIAEQNAIIAQNNAIIAAQNREIAQLDALAQAAYDKAQRLGLVQSFAAADMDYYYQNGVFYVLDADGEYRVIIPPAGALVDSLPSDRTTVTLGGEVLYKVDDTIYQSRNIDGVLYFEVLGQLYE